MPQKKFRVNPTSRSRDNWGRSIHRQTDRHTHRQTDILPTIYGRAKKFYIIEIYTFLLRFARRGLIRTIHKCFIANISAVENTVGSHHRVNRVDFYWKIITKVSAKIFFSSRLTWAALIKATQCFKYWSTKTYHFVNEKIMLCFGKCSSLLGWISLWVNYEK
jgi:hypothetical protein